MHLLSRLLLVISISVVLVSCRESRHNKRGVELAMQKYDYLIQKMDFDAIAMLYTAFQKGSYHQSDEISGKDTLHVEGDYKAIWAWNSQNGWHIKEMTTH